MQASSGILDSVPTTTDRLHRKGSWTPSEDALLTRLMQGHQGSSSDKSRGRAGHVNWVGIAQHFDGRNAKDCRKRWNSSLCPGISRGSWTPSEDKLLRQGMQMYPNQWAKIATYLGSRTGDQCSSRWRVLSSGADWNEERDRILLDFVNRHGKRWAEVRRLWLPMFTNAECRNRYHRIIRRLSADKRHETELETLKLVCNGEAGLCTFSSSSPDKGDRSDAGCSTGADQWSRRVSDTSSCGGSSSKCAEETQPFAAQAVRAHEGPMAALIKQMMTNESARDKLMKLAETIVSVSQTSDNQQQQQQLQGSEEKHSLVKYANDKHVEATRTTGIAGAVDDSMPQVDEQAWAAVLGLTHCDAAPTAAAIAAITPPFSPTTIVPITATPTTTRTATTTAAELGRMLDVPNCNECKFEPCVCSWTDMCLSQAWVHPECALSGGSSSSGTCTSTSTSTRTSFSAMSPLRLPTSASEQASSYSWWI